MSAGIPFPRVLSKSLIALAACMILPIAYAASIYKTVDADGNVIYTDVAPKEKAVEVEIRNSNTYVAPPIARPKDNGRNGEGGDSESTARYTSLKVLSPQHDEAIRNNAGNVDISVETKPGLQDGHRFEVLLDGKPVSADSQTNAGSGLSLTNVDRGTHTATVQIVDANNNVVRRSKPITFHLLRVNLNSPSFPPPPPPPPPASTSPSP